MMADRAPVIVLSLALAGAIVGARAAPRPEIPLIIEKVEVIDQQISVTVHNAGARTMTAWGMRAQVTYADRTTMSPIAMVDGYESGYVLSQEDTALAPGQTQTRLLAPGLRDVSIVSVSVAPLAVIYDDATTEGDEGILEMVFWRRAKNRRVWHFFEAVLDRVALRASDPQRLVTDLRTALKTDADGEIQETRSYMQFRARLLGPNGLPSVGRAELPRHLQELQNEVRARRIAADEHHRPR